MISVKVEKMKGFWLNFLIKNSLKMQWVRVPHYLTTSDNNYTHKLALKNYCCHLPPFVNNILNLNEISRDNKWTRETGIPKRCAKFQNNRSHFLNQFFFFFFFFLNLSIFPGENFGVKKITNFLDFLHKVNGTAIVVSV